MSGDQNEQASGDLRLKPPCRRTDALAVVRRLQEHGHVAYFAGGCVRDQLMGMEPKDYDVATDAPPARVKEIFPRAQAVGAAFGVMLVRLGASVVEMATFRTDAAYHDGRRPSAVTFSDARHDALRRDFTINGLFSDPVADRVIDYVGGRQDIQDRVLRTIGEADHRFEEDHLRLLRAVRFAARLGLRIEDATAEAIRRHAPKLPRISPERIADELRLMLTGGKRISAWEMLNGFGLLDQVLRFLGEMGLPAPAVPAGQPAREPTASAKSIFGHLAGATIPFSLAMAAVVVDAIGIRQLLSKEQVRGAGQAVRKALRWSNEEAGEFKYLLLNLHPLLVEPVPAVAALKRFLAAPAAGSSRAILRALADIGEFTEQIGRLLPVLDELGKADFAPPPLITGDDLRAAGLAPGPAFRRILDAVYDAQLEGVISSKTQAMEMAAGLAGGRTR